LIVRSPRTLGVLVAMRPSHVRYKEQNHLLVFTFCFYSIIN
jgi:hypothetical protein